MVNITNQMNQRDRLEWWFICAVFGIDSSVPSSRAGEQLACLAHYWDREMSQESEIPAKTLARWWTKIEGEQKRLETEPPATIENNSENSNHHGQVCMGCNKEGPFYKDSKTGNPYGKTSMLVGGTVIYPVFRADRIVASREVRRRTEGLVTDSRASSVYRERAGLKGRGVAKDTVETESDSGKKEAKRKGCTNVQPKPDGSIKGTFGGTIPTGIDTAVRRGKGEVSAMHSDNESQTEPDSACGSVSGYTVSKSNGRVISWFSFRTF